MAEVFGVRLIGISWENLHRLLLTAGFVTVALALRWMVVRLVRLVTHKRANERTVFWTRQGASLLAALVIVVGVVSIWFDNPARLALPAGMITAGVAFALQRVITAIAGYVVIMRGRTFSVGDRIMMGGVRGDVIALGFVQTVILEMGQPPTDVHGTSASWVSARQYTGRVVTVTNDKVFETAVYNYSREFPFIWEEMRVPVRYDADRARAEAILLDATRAETCDIEKLSAEHRERLRREYFVEVDRDEPHVYWRITDNWLELGVRFVCRPHEVRALKDRITRRILAAFDQSGIAVASSTFDVVGLPPLRVEKQHGSDRT